MELQIVNKEIAIQLKELGFDWEVNAYYKEELYEQIKNEVYKDCCSNNFSQYIDDISAPTQALVCKWFREKFQIYIQIEIDMIVLNKELYNYVIFISNKNTKFGIQRRCKTTSYDTFEQAEEAGILKAIEILKGK